MGRVRFGDWTLQPPWTATRARALKVLAVNGSARCSSVFPTSFRPPSVFAASAKFLVDRGLADIAHQGEALTVELTEAGRIFVQVLDAQKTNA